MIFCYSSSYLFSCLCILGYYVLCCIFIITLVGYYMEVTIITVFIIIIYLILYLILYLLYLFYSYILFILEL